MKAKLGVPLTLFFTLMLLATLVGCGADTTQAAVSDDEKAVIEKFVAAHLSDDQEAMADLFTEGAILDDHFTDPPARVEGRDQIVAYVSDYPELDWQVTDEPLKVGDYVVQPVSLLVDGKPSAQGVHVLEIAGDQIKHIWVTVTPTSE